MSRSGYSIGNASQTLPESSKVSVGKGPVKDVGAGTSSSCYYIPTAVVRTLQDNRTYHWSIGGINLHLVLEKDRTLNDKKYKESKDYVIYHPAPRSFFNLWGFLNRNKPYYYTHQKAELTKAYNQPILSAHEYRRPLNIKKLGIDIGKGMHDVYPSEWYHTGHVVKLADGQEFLIEKGAGYGHSSNTIVKMKSEMEPGWYPVGDEKPITSLVKIGDLVEAGGKRYILLLDDCQDAVRRMQNKLCIPENN
jgi:hypothetical protein